MSVICHLTAHFYFNHPSLCFSLFPFQSTCFSSGCNIDNCDQCAGHELHNLHVGCLECQAGYLLKRNIFKDECVAVCPDGFYPGVKPGTNTSACLDCQVQFCQSCLRRGKCSECFQPFVISFKTGKCTLCKPGTFYHRRSKSCKTLPVVEAPVKKLGE